jgi:hypothetical protein
VAADVARHLAAAGREPDERDVAQVELLDQLSQVVGVRVHLVAVPRLRRAAVATAVMRDRAEAVLGQEQLLRLPAVRVKRPAVAEHDRGTAAPILVEDLRAIAGGDGRHDFLLRRGHRTVANWVPVRARAFPGHRGSDQGMHGRNARAQRASSAMPALVQGGL